MILKDDFERDYVLGTLWWKEFADTSYSATLSSRFKKSGTKSLRMELHKDDPIINGSKRSEITLLKTPNPLAQCIYRNSIYLPKGGEEDYAVDPKGSEIIWQWHNVPDAGEEWTSPPLALHTGWYYVPADHYCLEVNSDPTPLSTNNTLVRNRFDLGSFINDKGRWTNWEFRIKWGWLPEHNPSIVVLKNGKQIFKTNIPNMTNDKAGTHMKMGIYKWDWAQVGDANKSILNKRIIYYDNVYAEFK